MEQFTKEQLIAQAREDADTWRDAAEHFSAHPAQRLYAAVRLRVAEIALAVLTAPDIEPIYQYRIRNGYNGQVTEWQTIRRDQVDFVLKAQPNNAEFQIITAQLPAEDAGRHFQRGYDEGHSRGLACGKLYKSDDQMRQHRAACAAAYRAEMNREECNE